MTDRIRTIHVTLDRDYRVDDGKTILHAIQMIKGVSGAEYGDVVSLEQYSAREVGREELVAEIREVLKPAWVKRAEALREER